MLRFSTKVVKSYNTGFDHSLPGDRPMGLKLVWIKYGIIKFKMYWKRTQYSTQTDRYSHKILLSLTLFALDAEVYWC